MTISLHQVDCVDSALIGLFLLAKGRYPGVGGLKLEGVSRKVAAIFRRNGAGYLLSFGYFFAMGPALMTAFSPSELALAGFTRMAGAVVGRPMPVESAHTRGWAMRPATVGHTARG